MIPKTAVRSPNQARWTTETSWASCSLDPVALGAPRSEITEAPATAATMKLHVSLGATIVKGRW